MLTFLGYCQKHFFQKNLAIAFTYQRCIFNRNWPGVDKTFKNKSRKMSNAVQ